ncbi:MAG: helix-turn-helix transcriptional regulator, partial [Acetobacteraceae bacterium]|nr:helix-turn-helix transcriptional regulator [Acetobacteraceae bacterium]
RLLRKEFAHILLDGNPRVDEPLPELMARIGLRRYPNRAMLISPESAESYGAFGLSFQLAFSSMLAAMDQVCGALPDICFAYLHQCGFCVFFCDREDAGDLYTTAARSLAEKILAAVSAACGLRARVGIGSVKQDWKVLVDSYQEACVALRETGERIAVYHEIRESTAELSCELAELTRCIADRKIADARRAVGTLSLAVQRRPAGGNALEAQRRLCEFALAKMLSVSANFGDDAPDGMELVRGLATAPSAATLQRSFLAAAERILSWIESVYSGQHEKRVRLAYRLIERALEHSDTARAINIHDIAASVGVSAAYLTRLFKRDQGMTFERYVMHARIALAQKLFLDPMLPVCAVADKCGFTDVAYFARVFRQVMGCSPTAYRQNPRRFLPDEFSRNGEVQTETFPYA